MLSVNVNVMKVWIQQSRTRNYLFGIAVSRVGDIQKLLQSWYQDYMIFKLVQTINSRYSTAYSN